MTVLSWWVEGAFHWNGEIGNGIVDLAQNRLLVGLDWSASIKRRKPKHIWVRRMARGGIRVAPGVIPTWVPNDHKPAEWWPARKAS